MPSSNPSGSMPPSDQPSDQPSLSGAPSIQQSLSPSESSAPSEQPSAMPSNSPSIEFCQPRENLDPNKVACNTETQLQLASAGSCIGISSCFDNEREIGINSCTGEDPEVGGLSACESNRGEIGDGSW